MRLATGADMCPEKMSIVQDEPNIVAPAPREARAPRRTAAAAATKKYIELSSSESEVEADNGGDSDFEASD